MHECYQPSAAVDPGRLRPLEADVQPVALVDHGAIGEAFEDAHEPGDRAAVGGILLLQGHCTEIELLGEAFEEAARVTVDLLVRVDAHVLATEPGHLLGEISQQPACG
jgi:hypothetical protein